MSHGWPLPRAALAGQVGVDGPAHESDPEPFLPIALDEHVALIKAGGAIDAFARKRAVQIVTHGHTAERDLERDLASLAREAKARLHAFLDVVPLGRMNLPPATRERCLSYVEVSAALLIALYDRCQIEVPE